MVYQWDFAFLLRYVPLFWKGVLVTLAYTVGTITIGLGQLAHQHRDEDHVVDAEHHLHHGERQQGDPGVGVEQQIGHRSLQRGPGNLGRGGPR